MENDFSETKPVRRQSLASIIIFIIIFIVLLPLLIVAALVYIAETIFLYISIWIIWGLRGRSVLFVYSDSPIWKHYLEQDIIPRIEKRAIFLNWSERKHWKNSLAVLAFKHFGGTRNFNPMAIVFRPFRFQKSFGFYEAFKDFKHGNTASVERIKRELFVCLGINGFE